MAVRAVMKAATKVNLMEFLVRPNVLAFMPDVVLSMTWGWHGVQLGDFKVIHFTGHGVSQAELLLENEDGSVASMERAVLWELLSNGVGRNVRWFVCEFAAPRFTLVLCVVGNSQLRLLFLSCCGAENIIARTPEGAESGIAHVVAVARGVEVCVWLSPRCYRCAVHNVTMLCVCLVIDHCAISGSVLQALLSTVVLGEYRCSSECCLLACLHLIDVLVPHPYVCSTSLLSGLCIRNVSEWLP